MACVPQTLVELLSQSARKYGQQIAIDHEDGVITYSGLESLSTAFAQRLRSHGVKTGDHISLLTAHGTRNVVAILGILKAGACYIPMDQDTWSAERINTVLDTIDSRVIVNTTEVTFRHSGSKVIHFLDLKDIEYASGDGYNEPEATQSSLACIIFTSGSTGKPKGVMIPHRAIVNYALTSPFNMNVGPTDRVLHILSVAFDASTGMLFSILAGGGAIVPATKLNLMTKALSCSILACTPSILATLPPPSQGTGEDNKPFIEYRKLHTVLLGGEAIPGELLDNWCSPKVKILNAYGPTETTVASLMHIIEHAEDSRNRNNSIIGKAMPNGPVYIIDDDLNQLTEQGQEGEIIISGQGLADGYFNDEEKTKKAFIIWAGQRAYRTGDYGRWTNDNLGNLVIEFRGRRDRVVKNRGFLVNIEADVEAPMAAMGFGIQGVHVALLRRKLVALVFPETIDTRKLRKQMLEKFSAYMVPDRIEAVERLPTTANGKIDSKKVLQLLEDMHLVEDTKGEPLGQDVQGRKWEIVNESATKVLGLPNSCLLKPHSNLFVLGASSLDIMTFVSLCHSSNLQISPRQVYTLQTLEAISDSAHMITEARGQVEDSKSSPQQVASTKPSPNAFSAQIGGDTVAPMTTLQLQLAEPTKAINGRNTNQICLRYDLKYAEALESSWWKVWTSEPVFRTQFHMECGLGIQVVRHRPLMLPEVAQYSDRVAYKKAMLNEPLSVGLGSRLKINKYIPEPGVDHAGEVVVIWTVHHCLVDGYAMAAILSKVEAVAAGSPLEQSPSFVTAAWDLIEKQNAADGITREFWQTYLRDVPIIETIGLPLPSSGDSGLACEIKFSSTVQMPTLRRSASENKVTLATLFYTAWAMVVSKYTDREAVTVGAVVSGRQTPLVSQTAVGTLMANLPLKVRIKADWSVSQLLRETMEGLSQISEFSWSTPDQINHRLSSVIALQYDYPEYELSIPRLSTECFENTAFPLNLLVEEEGIFRLVFDSSVYSQNSAEDITKHFQNALQALCECRNVKDCMPKIISERENDRILREWNSSESIFENQDANVQEAFSKSCQLHADLSAVELGQQILTYSQLRALANKVAITIQRTFPLQKPIAIHADGSINWLIGILGILKAGHAYCPLDPQYTFSRRVAVCHAAEVAGVVFPFTNQSCESPLPGHPGVVVEEVIQDDMIVEDICYRSDPSSDAIIVFTSGTTGAPKGVPISHRGLLALQSNPEATMFSSPGKRIAQMMAPAFDYCANEIFSALLHGGTLILRDPADLYSHLKTVDAATLTPSLMGALNPNDYPRLRTIYATGEPVTPGLVKQWGRQREFYNAYGPAEASICVSFTKMKVGEPITIGRAIRTARMYVLDRNRCHQVVGALGELYLAGVQVSRGYLNSEEQKRMRFVPDPWFPGQVMYKTGDFCRWTHNGQVSYVGRLDRQVKIRGFRVELPSVEQQIYVSDSKVSLAAVLVVNDALVAVVKPASVDTERLGRRLQHQLPPTWIPQRWVAVDHFPLTANKKLDLQALQSSLGRGGARSTSIEALHGHVAEQIAQEWRNLLKLPLDTTISPSERFSQLGGHSILQIQLAVRLASRFRITISVRDTLLADTLRDLVDLVQARQSDYSKHGELQNSVALAKSNALSPLESYQFSSYKIATSATTFNIPVLISLRGSFSRKDLIAAINNVLASNEIYRSNYSDGDDNKPRRSLRSAPPRVHECVVSDLESEVNHKFILCQEELIRVHFWDDKLLIVVSHILADLNSLQNFFGQVSSVFNGAILPGSKVIDYTGLQRWIQPVSLEDIDFWRNELLGARHQLVLERHKSRTVFFDGISEVIQLPSGLTGELLRTVHEQRVTRHQLATGAVSLVLQHITSTNDIVLGAPYSGRTSAAEQEAMGLLLDRLPIRINNVSDDMSIASFLRHVRGASQAALAHAIPFSTLLDILGADQQAESESSTHPVFEAMVTFHLDKGPQELLCIPDCTVSAIPVHASGSKFLLMFEWTEYAEDDWRLRIEYDSYSLSTQTIELIKNTLDAVLKGLCSEKTISALRRTLP
ncbi:putative non-ribosomal peptide synthetase GliP [Coleophoma cylindrospora]|uniref:Putative non-ribosomal peptide synthetase GliP n=1 Tax=Coleophoma cylindrospora TaxID=1849047 RepID=A0A3D8RA64_9HELO|nr:putative non-ribosomal peptide synthetase GliP [Coleophoma cylindrospora]